MTGVIWFEKVDLMHTRSRRCVHKVWGEFTFTFVVWAKLARRFGEISCSFQFLLLGSCLGPCQGQEVLTSLAYTIAFFRTKDSLQVPPSQSAATSRCALAKWHDRPCGNDNLLDSISDVKNSNAIEISVWSCRHPYRWVNSSTFKHSYTHNITKHRYHTCFSLSTRKTKDRDVNKPRIRYSLGSCHASTD